MILNMGSETTLQGTQEAFDPYCDRVKLAAIGAQVRQRLSTTRGVVQVPNNGAEIYMADKFLVGPDCREIIKAINSNAVPSTLYKGTGGPELRTSQTHHFVPGNTHTSELEQYICEISGLDMLHAEGMQGQRYQKSQQYRHHHDFFHLGDGYWQQERLNGGQRTWTAMITLNEPREGGETEFPHLNKSFKPKSGRLLLWNNMLPDGRPNMNTLHAGLPVIRGIKHIVTLWFRQEPWRLINNFD